MWQAGWHFTQWQHIARSLLSLSLLSPCLCHRLFSVFCARFFPIFTLVSFFEDFFLFTFCYFFLISSYALFLSWLPNLLFFLSTSHYSLSASFFLSVALSQSLLPLFQASNGYVEKLVARLKQHLGIFSTSCVCVCMCAYHGVSCLFNVTHISLHLPRWPILCCSC